MKKMKPSAFILPGILLVGIIALGVYLFYLSRQPLGQPLVLEPRLATAAPSGLEEATSSTASTPTATVAAADSASGKVCGQSEAYIILIIGSDIRELRGTAGSDLIRLARVDFPRKKVSIFALPRDLWVDVRDLGFQNPPITDTTLGRAYYEAYQRSVQAEEPGKMTDSAQATAQMILDNFEVTSDHYIVIDLSQLPNMIDSIGGLPIDIPERTTDPWIGTVIEAGPQTLTGERLVAYARAKPDSDFARIQRNNVILHALRLKLLEPSVWVKLPSLYNKFRDMIVTDLSPQLISNFFCLLKEVPKEEIVMEQIEPEWTSPGPSDSLLWDKDKITAALRQMDLLP